MVWRGSRLLKHFIQYMMLMMAWFTCMSRISDYKHHWSDVLAGGAIGATVALLVVSIQHYLLDQFIYQIAKFNKIMLQIRQKLTIRHKRKIYYFTQ